MANTIESVPEATRWEIATKGLTGAYTAISKALQQAVGQKGFEEFNGALWYEAGKGAKVSNTRRIDMVVVNGRVFDRAARAAMLREMAQGIASEGG